MSAVVLATRLGKVLLLTHSLKDRIRVSGSRHVPRMLFPQGLYHDNRRPWRPPCKWLGGLAWNAWNNLDRASRDCGFFGGRSEASYIGSDLLFRRPQEMRNRRP